MHIRIFIKKLLLYYKRHGLSRLVYLTFIRYWRKYIDNREVVFFIDLHDMKKKDISFPKNLIVESCDNIEGIPRQFMEQLIKIKSEVILFPFLEKYFQKGATFWLGIQDNNVVGHQWSLVRGFNGFYSLPITTKDAIIFATEVYPDFRGHGINPALTEMIFSKLRNDGISHIYLKVHISNEAQLRSLKKTNFERIGIVRNIKLFNRYITIWDKKSIMVDEKKC